MPAALRISADCMNLLEAMLKADPAERITLGRIREHPWFLGSLPIELQARRAAPLTRRVAAYRSRLQGPV